MAPRVDPYKNFNFRVEIDGLTVAGFSECSGLETEVSVIDYREGGDFLVRKLPGLAKVGDVTLKRGITKSNDLQNWHRNVLNGVADRKNVVVILMDDARTPVVVWKLFDAFPRKWEGPTLRAQGNEIAIEALVLSCEGLERDNA
jgi:phage tail-like protein